MARLKAREIKSGKIFANCIWHCAISNTYTNTNERAIIFSLLSYTVHTSYEQNQVGNLVNLYVKKFPQFLMTTDPKTSPQAKLRKCNVFLDPSPAVSGCFPIIQPGFTVPHLFRELGHRV